MQYESACSPFSSGVSRLSTEDRMIDERRLAEKLRNGDTAALERIMEGFAGYVCAVIRNFSRGSLSEEDIDELCSDVFFKIWQRRETLDPEIGLRAYLSAVARNAVKNRFRDAPPPAEDISELQIPDDLSVEKAAELNEMLNCLNDALKTLREEERKIFMRFYFYGETSSEIARKTGLGESSVRSKLSRTRTKLKNYLIKRGFEHV